MGEPVKIDVLLETREAEREAARTRAELGALEGAVGRLDARTKEFRRSLEGGTSQVSALGRQLRDAFSGVTQQDLAALRGNAVAAFEVIRGGAESMARSAGEAERLGRANRALGLDYAAAARGAGGVLDELQLLNATQALTARGIRLNQVQLAAFGRAAQDYARNSGREFGAVSEQLAEVIAKGGEEAARFGPALGSLAAPTATATDRLDALVRTTRESAPAAQTSAEAYRDLGQAVTDAERSFSEGFAEGIAEMRRLHGESTSARDVMRELKDDMYALGGATATVIGAMADGFRVVATEIGNVVEGVGDAVDTLAQIRQNPLRAGEILRGFGVRDQAREASSEAAFMRLWTTLRGGDRTSLAVDGGAAATGAPARRFALGNETEGGFDGGRAADYQAFLQQTARGGAANDNAASASLLTVGSAQVGEIFDRVLAQSQSQRAQDFERLATAALGLREADEIRQITGVSREDAAARLGDLRDPIDERNARLNRRQVGGTLGDRLDARESGRRQRELDEQLDAQQSYTDRMRDMHSERASLAQSEAEAVSMGFGAMGKALGAHVNAVVQGRETLAFAAQAMVSDTLVALGQEAVVKGAMQIAEGLAMLAGIYTAPLAPAHFAAGAAFMGVGALVGAAGAAIAPAPSTPAGAGGAPSAPVGALAAANDNGGRNGPTEITINLGGGVVLGTGRELGEALGRVINDPNAGVSINASRVSGLRRTG
jgi:hypothetical protein